MPCTLSEFVTDRFDKERLRGEVFQLLVGVSVLHGRLECTTDGDDVCDHDVEFLLDEMERVDAAANALIVRARKLVRDRIERVLKEGE